MSKAIFIMDMPENCVKCNLRFDNYGICDICILADDVIDAYYETYTKPDWCPLKELPEKYDIEDVLKKPHDRDWTGEFEAGYNACIDEILGE